MNQLKSNLINHVKFLSSLGEKSVRYPSQLQIAKDYIIGNFGRNNIKVQQYICDNVSVSNIELTLEGSYNSNETILVGAHYDTLYTGANDNCSGIACLLELMEMFKEVKIDRTVKFVVFTNEEPPYFMTNKMGSKMYAKMCYERKDNIKIALVMDLVGCYTDEPNSQKYPFINKALPTTGNFICFTGQKECERVIVESYNKFKDTGSFPIEYMLFDKKEYPSYCSDHASFMRYGYPSFLVTDTAFLRYPYYHTELDTPEKLNYDKMTDMTMNLFEMLKQIVGVVK